MKKVLVTMFALTVSTSMFAALKGPGTDASTTDNNTTTTTTVTCNSNNNSNSNCNANTNANANANANSNDATTTTTDTSSSDKNNNGHGNNVDGVDSSNPGQGKGGPNGTTDASGTVDDEKTTGNSKK